VFERIDADGLQAFEIKFLNVFRRGLHNHLELVVTLQAVGVFAVAPVGGAATGFDYRHIPWFGTQRAQKGMRIHGAGSDFDVVALTDDAALCGPEILQSQCKFLEIHLKPLLSMTFHERNRRFLEKLRFTGRYFRLRGSGLIFKRRSVRFRQRGSSDFIAGQSDEFTTMYACRRSS